MLDRVPANAHPPILLAPSAPRRPPPPPPLLLQYEWRFGALVRLVKLWARRWGVNDSTAGTLNSFALTMLVRGGCRGWRYRWPWRWRWQCRGGVLV